MTSAALGVVASGVDVGWYPSQISGVVAWLRAADMDVSRDDGGTVSSWVDRISALNFAQNFTSQRPFFYVSTAAHLINSQPCVHFDGSNDFVRYAGTLTTGIAGHIFVVMKAHSFTSTPSIVTSADEASTTRLLLAKLDVSGVAQATQQDTGTADQIRATTTTLVAETPYLVEWASSGTVYDLRVNNTVQAKSVISGVDNGDWFGDTSARDNVVIGALKRTTETNFFDGDIAEVVIVDGAISAGDRTLFNTYITARYGLTLA